MQVIILAAGRGDRLSPITDTVPKPLVEVNGTPLIVNALDALSRHEIERFVVVVGYGAATVKAHLGDEWGGVEIVYVENAQWETTNNIYSLWLTRDMWDRDTMLLECDIFFEAGMIDALLSKPFENMVLVDRFQPYMDGTVVEISPEMELVRMIPAKDQDENFNYYDKYKTVNMYTFTEEFLRELFRPTMDLYIKAKGQNEYYELVLAVLVFMGNQELKAHVCAPHRWFEIDDFTDLQRAEAYVTNSGLLLEKVRSSYGGYWRYDFSDFEYLYNSYFPPTSLVNELRLNLGDLLRNYPSGQFEINESLANWARIDQSQLAVANGGSELIAMLKAYAGKIAVLAPGFDEYRRGLPGERLHVIEPDTETLGHTPLGIVEETIASGAEALVLVNPNNPTGAYFNREELRYMLKALKHLKMFILDESFADFISTDNDSSLLNELAGHANLVILRSLSKDLGIPGLRLGYVASGNTQFIAEIRERLPIWHINSIAQHFINILPKYKKEYAVSREKMIRNRDEMKALLEGVPDLTVFPSFANYFCCKLPPWTTGTALQEYLFTKHNILIKDLASKPGLTPHRFIRVAVKTPEENKQLASAMTAGLVHLGGRIAA